MTREEAIKILQDVRDPRIREAICTLHPELRESEDERIRREIIDFIQWAEDRGMTRHDYHQAKRPAVWIAYLEKRKNLFKGGVGYYFYDGNITHFIGAPAMEELIPVEETCKESLHISETCKEKPNSFTDEDERIRSVILKLVLGMRDEIFTTADKLVTKPKVLAWLKKQKEQKPEERFEEAREKYQVKWKLPEDFEEAVYKVANFISPFDSQDELRRVSHRFAEQLMSLAKKELVEKLAKWSEEDERIMQSIIKDIEWDRNYISATTGKVSEKYNEQLAWFKSLPERFNLQPKQEWDTHDKAMVTCIVCCLDGKFVTEAARKQALEWFNKHRRDFLNSSSWKPSEEQMGALNYAYCELFKRGDVGHNILGSLQKLIDQLREQM